MVAETASGQRQDMDSESQDKTILQNIRYFNKKELVQYVCHADDESRQQEERALGHVSIFGVPHRRTNEKSHHDDETVAKKNPKLVRFNSRPQIYDDEDENPNWFKQSRVRPATPKLMTPDTPNESDAGLHFPLLKKHVIDSETSSHGLHSNSSESLRSQRQITKSHTSRFLANVTHPTALGCSPPNPDSMLKKVLNRGAFGGSHNNIPVSVRETDSEFEKRSRQAQRTKVLRWISPTLRDSDNSSESSSTRSSSLTRNNTEMMSNRELMTSPLSMLELRDSMESGLSHGSANTSRSNLTDTSAQYPVMTPQEHFEFIKYALSPSLRPLNQSSWRGRATTISGGEKPEWLVNRRQIKGRNKSVQKSASLSVETLSVSTDKRSDGLKKYSKKHLNATNKPLV